jgi:hypothetical protein
MALDIKWIDGGRAARNASDPAFPRGVDVDLSKRAINTCMIELPYPAKRVGHFVVACAACGQRVVVTTAGRSDDPRSVKLGCWTARRQNRLLQ